MGFLLEHFMKYILARYFVALANGMTNDELIKQKQKIIKLISLVLLICVFKSTA